VKIVAKTIYTQFDEMVNYDNIVIVGVKPIFEEDEDDEGKVSVLLDYEMFGRDVTGMEIPFGLYSTREEAEKAVKALHEWFSNQAYAVYEVPKPEGADT